MQGRKWLRSLNYFCRRWFENLKLILSGTTRPTKRGVLFNNTRLRKIPISRHYKKVRLSVSLNRFHVCYWVSFSMQSGIEILSGKLSSSSGIMRFLVTNVANCRGSKSNSHDFPFLDWNLQSISWRWFPLVTVWYIDPRPIGVSCTLTVSWTIRKFGYSLRCSKK